MNCYGETYDKEKQEQVTDHMTGLLKGGANEILYSGVIFMIKIKINLLGFKQSCLYHNLPTYSKYIRCLVSMYLSILLTNTKLNLL